MRDSLAAQARWLVGNLETHILANHYFENLKALVFVGAVLPDPSALRWQRHGEAGLREQLQEQFLPDGGHYERSPSYHCLLLGGLLELLELDVRVLGMIDGKFVEMVRDYARRAIVLLAAIELPGDRYPLFNDSAFDSAPRPSTLYLRARLLGLEWALPVPGVLRLPDFGVFGWRDSAGGEMRISVVRSAPTTNLVTRTAIC